MARALKNRLPSVPAARDAIKLADKLILRAPGITEVLAYKRMQFFLRQLGHGPWSNVSTAAHYTLIKIYPQIRNIHPNVLQRGLQFSPEEYEEALLIVESSVAPGGITFREAISMILDDAL